MKHKYIECECETVNHILRFTHDDNPSWPEIFVDVHLNQHYGFFKRLWYGIKYIFGFKSKYGQFEEVLLGKEKVKELRDFCNEWLEKHRTSAYFVHNLERCTQRSWPDG